MSTAETSPKKKKSLVRRILKWSGITLLLLIITAIILPFLFKDKIIEMAKAEMNKNLNATIAWGDFDLSLLSSFPDFRFSINDVSVVGKDAFAGDTLASIPALKLDLDLMSVIKGDQYEVNSISLDRPRIMAKVLSDGKANWDITKPDTAAATPAGEPTKFRMSMKKLSIDHGYIVYDDASLDVKSVLDDMNYTLSGDFTQDYFEMENDILIERTTVEYGGMTYMSKVKTAIKAALDMDMVKSKYSFKENEFDFNELGFTLNGYFAMPGEDYDMDLKFAAKQNEFKSFLSLIPGAYTKDFANVKTSGKLAFDGYAKGIYSEKQNKMPGYGLNLLITDASVQYPSVPKAISDINVDCRINSPSGVPDATKIDVNKFHMNFGGSPVDAALHVATPVSDASIDGWVKGSVDLASMKDMLPLEPGEQLTGKVNADVKMKGRMSQIEKEQYDQFQCSGAIGVKDMLYKTPGSPDVTVSAMNLEFTPRFLNLTDFTGNIGKSDVRANGHIDNFMAYLFKDSLLTGVFNMSSSSMDLNQFAGEEAAPAQPAAAETGATEVIEVPANLDFTLNTTITKLVYDDINMSNVTGAVIVRNEAIDISQLKMNLMGGSMVMNGRYSTQTPVPKVDFDLDIANFDIQETFKTIDVVEKVAPVAKFSKGKFSTRFKFASDLDKTMMPIVTTMNGAGTLSTKQVEVDGFGPLKKLDEALKLNKFKKVTLNDINNLSFKIENGRVTTEPFDFKVGKLSGKMGGSTGVDQSINYVMDIAIPRSEFGPANSALDGMVSSATSKGIPVKLGDNVNVQALFGGTVTDPTVKTNLKEAGGDLMDQLKENIVTAVKDTVKAVITNKACEEADKALNATKVNAANAKAQAIKAADDLKASSLVEADKMANKGGNPLEKAANKKIAETMRKAAETKHKDAVAAAEKTERETIAKAQAERDAKCK